MAHHKSSPHPNLDVVLSATQAFVETELLPLEKEKNWQDGGWIFPILEEKRAKVKKAGLWLPQIPQAWGGLGLSLAEHGQVSAILGQSPFGHYVFNCQAPDAGNMELLLEYGSAEQQERFLKPLLAGEIRSCFSMTEPEFAGSNPVMMGTTATKEGETYVINGHKWFTTAADGAAFAIVMCITHPNAESPHLRASQIIVPSDTEGFQHIRRIPIMGDEGQGWLSHSEICYENCRVPQSHLLGGEGQGFALAQSRLGPGRIHHCMRWLGIGERVFNMMVERAKTRKISENKTLAHQQTIQNWVAECRAELYAARLMVMDTARKIDENGVHAAKEEISIIKFYCAQVLQKVMDCAVQVHGALGMTEDTVLSFYYRHERGARIYDGADEVHKSSLAKAIFKKHGLKH